MKTMSVSKYAEHAGVTRQTIYDWAKYDTGKVHSLIIPPYTNKTDEKNDHTQE